MGYEIFLLDGEKNKTKHLVLEKKKQIIYQHQMHLSYLRKQNSTVR